MTDTPRAFDLDRDGDRLVLALHGEWRLARLAALQAAFDALPPDALTRGAVCLDGRGLAGIDTAGALLLWRGVQAAGAAPEHCALEAFDPMWNALAAAEQERLVHLLVRSVEYDAASEAVSVTFHAQDDAEIEEAACQA